MRALQLALLTFVISTLVAIALFSGDISESASKDIQLLNSAELSSSSLVLAQMESMEYTVRYTQWLNGEIERRDVQISRALLAQRLNVVTSTLLSTGQVLPPTYFENLAKSDSLLEKSQPGYLPNSASKNLRTESMVFIHTMLVEVRNFFPVYLDSLNQLSKKSAIDRDFKAKRLLFVLYLFLGLSLILFALFSFILIRQHRRNTIANSEQLRLINESTTKLADSNLVVRELELLDERKNVFISTVNHELRTPLTLIIGYIDILRKKLKGDASEELLNIVNVMERNSNNLLDLVQSILSLTNLESGSANLPKSAVDLKEVAEDSILLLAPVAEKAQVSIALGVEAGLGTLIVANRGQLLTVVNNLLSNAIKFNRLGGSVEITIDKDPTQDPIRSIRISVGDEGIGIPEPELNEIFASFFRASNVRDGGISGTGLGLSIVSQIIAEHHGVITVESTLNVGTVFRVEVPIFVPESAELI